eukprot:TRINITY_DN16935_c0_g1_i1.p1 TRINITY_DN16935_c0_g1~~TRINITY_DN16935_c0_g1_i1.p1  ORF type:complete len:515 (-),score=121.80 TRINITY_DN16935_c0_g1_i1:82-1626(-)
MQMQMQQRVWLAVCLCAAVACGMSPLPAGVLPVGFARSTAPTSIPIGPFFTYQGVARTLVDSPCTVAMTTLHAGVFYIDMPSDRTSGSTVHAFVPESDTVRGALYEVHVSHGSEYAGSTCVVFGRDEVSFTAQPGERYYIAVTVVTTGADFSYGIEVTFVMPDGYCGNLMADGREQCDGGLGCASDCTCQDGFAAFYPPTAACYAQAYEYCGNNLVEGREQCDGGHGCASDCMCQSGFHAASPATTSCMLDASAGCPAATDVYDELLAESNGITSADVVANGCWGQAFGKWYRMSPGYDNNIVVAVCSSNPVYITVAELDCGADTTDYGGNAECITYGVDDTGADWCDEAYAYRAQFYAYSYNTYHILVGSNDAPTTDYDTIPYDIVVYAESYYDWLSLMAVLVAVLICACGCCFCLCCCLTCFGCLRLTRRSPRQTGYVIMRPAKKQKQQQQQPVGFTVQMPYPMQVTVPTPVAQQSAKEATSGMPQQLVFAPASPPPANAQPVPYAFLYPTN